MKNEIKKLLEAGGTIEFPYKRGVMDWYGQNRICLVAISARLQPSDKFAVSCSGRASKYFADIDEAIKYFMEITFTKKNIALAFDGIVRHKLKSPETEFDDMSAKTIGELVKKYIDELFDQDYGAIVSEI